MTNSQSPDQFDREALERLETRAGRQQPFAMAPHWVTLAPISCQAKTVYDALAGHVNHARSNDDVWPTLEHLAAALGFSKGQKLSRYVDELVTINAVERTEVRYAGGMRKRYVYTVHQAPPDWWQHPATWAEFYARLAGKSQRSPEHPHRGAPEHPCGGAPEHPCGGAEQEQLQQEQLSSSSVSSTAADSSGSPEREEEEEDVGASEEGQEPAAADPTVAYAWTLLPDEVTPTAAGRARLAPQLRAVLAEDGWDSPDGPAELAEWLRRRMPRDGIYAPEGWLRAQLEAAPAGPPSEREAPTGPRPTGIVPVAALRPAAALPPSGT